MWLYRHHTCNDIIELDHDSARWRPVDRSEHPPQARALADLPVRGSYIEVGDTRCYAYWTDDERFIFRTSDGFVCEICRKLPHGSMVECHPGLRCEIEPVPPVGGRQRPGMSEVRIVAAGGDVLYRLTYNAAYYQRLHAFDFTAASMVQGLSDWDFFVALQREIETFAESAASGRVPLTFRPDGSAHIEGLRWTMETALYAETGEACPRAGQWLWVDDLRRRCTVPGGQPMPDVDGAPAMWVWGSEA